MLDKDLSKASRLRNRLAHQEDQKHGFDLVAIALSSLGFKWVAGVGGTPVYQIFQACSRQHLKVIDTHTQACAVLMAASSAWVAGRPVGAAILSAGPAITNAMTGILVARDNGWPLIVLGGRRALDQGRGAFQALDGAALIKPIAKWTTCVEDASAIPPLIQKALQIACSGRPGPVYLDLPEDVLLARANAKGNIPPLQPEQCQPKYRNIEDTACRLIGAKQPVLILGDSLRWSADQERARSALKQSGLTVIPLPLLRGLIPEETPADIISPRQRAKLLSLADLVILLGCGLDWRLRFGAEIKTEVPIIAIDEGLYPLADQMRQPEQIEANSGAFLDQLLDKLESLGFCSVKKELKNTAGTSSPEPANSGISALTESVAFSIIQSHMPAKSFLVLDGSVVLSAGQHSIPRSDPFAILDPGWNGCIGTGLPFALGAKIESGTDPVVLCTGDFAFGFNMIELEASIRHHLPLYIFLLNNGGPIGRSNQFKPHSSSNPIHAYPSDLAYHQISNALGMRSFLATDAPQLHKACRSVFNHGSAAFVHIMMAPTSCGHPSDLVQA